MRTNHKWTEEERDIVRRDYHGDKASAEAIAAYLGVTFCAVKGQVQKLGLARQDRRPWTRKEDNRLQRLMRKECPRNVAIKMHRSINSVVLRAKRLSISRRDRDGWFTKADACAILGVDHKWVQKRIDLGVIEATHHNEESPPQKGGGSCWHIEQSALVKYIRRYPEELTSRNVDLIMIVDMLAGIDNSHLNIGERKWPRPRKNKSRRASPKSLEPLLTR